MISVGLEGYCDLVAKFASKGHGFRSPRWCTGEEGGKAVDRRPEMDRREVALELVKLAANTGFLVPGDKPEFEVLLRSYSDAFEAVIESERTPMLRK